MLDFSKIKCVVFDLDGTIYFGSTPAEKANDVINAVRNRFEALFFATNNSAKNHSEIFQRLIDMGINVKNKDEVITCAGLIADYLYKNNYQKVYCMGTDSLKNEIEKYNINAESENPEAIIIGYDSGFNIEKLENTINIYHKDCKIIIGNQDRLYPKDHGKIAAGAGAQVAAFTFSINKEVDIVIGKPQTSMLEFISEKLFIKPENILMVGDSLESDIAMAQNFGAQSLFITNGRHSTYNGCKIEYLADLLELIND